MDDNKKPQKDTHGTDPVTGVVQEYKAEFRRIVWPSTPTLIKHTVTVIAVSLMFGAFIALLDGAFGFGLRQFIQFVA